MMLNVVITENTTTNIRKFLYLIFSYMSNLRHMNFEALNAWYLNENFQFW